jgi:hypothetical protein
VASSPVPWASMMAPTLFITSRLSMGGR